MIYLFLGLSLITNGFSIWYAYSLLKDRIALVELFKSFSPIVKNYETHLESLKNGNVLWGSNSYGLSRTYKGSQQKIG